MIANLLNVKAKDGLSSLRIDFLRCFVEKLSGSFPNVDFDYEKTIVETEKYIGPKTGSTGGRMDIFIELRDKSNNKYAIVIENKVYAEDQKNQLIRYKDFLDKHYNYDKSVLIYLTLNGNNPSADSIGKNEKSVFWTNLTYRDDVVGWLNYCAEKAIKYPYIRESINQFRSQIQRLTGGDFIKMKEDELFKLLETKGNIEIAKSIAENYEKLHIKKIKEFKEKLDVKIEELFGTKPNTKVNRKPKDKDFGINYCKNSWKNLKIYCGFNIENIDFRLNIAYKNQNNDFKERCKAFFEEKLNTWTDFTNLSARRKLYNNFSDWIEDEQQKEILEELEKSVKLIDEVEENLK